MDERWLSYGAKAMSANYPPGVTDADFEDDMIECPECEGGGIIGKLTPVGHCEVTCSNCGGDGQIEKPGPDYDREAKEERDDS